MAGKIDMASVIFTLLPVLVTTIMLVLYFDFRKLIFKGYSASAEVIEIISRKERREMKSRRKVIRHYPVFFFRTDTGQEIKGEPDYYVQSGSKQTPTVGTILPIKYDPANPDKFMVCNPDNIKRFIGFVLFFILISSVIVILFFHTRIHYYIVGAVLLLLSIDFIRVFQKSKQKNM